MADPETLDTTIRQVADFYQTARDTLGKFIVGNRETLDIVLTALVANGHVLMEGVPGTAKTSIAKMLALISGCKFNRIQGVVDLMPSDMLGVWIYDSTRSKFIPRYGPIFTNILLVDEVNRINPKAQSAFIEAMSERQVTFDGVITPLPSPFFVIATQNPHEYEGTFPLIEVQRDRFMFSLRTSHLETDDELLVVRRASEGLLGWKEFEVNLRPIIDRSRLEKMIHGVQAVRMEDPVLAYIRDLVIASREHGDVDLGASSRASIALVHGSRVRAAFAKRTYVIPDDVKALAPYVFGHRIILTPEAEVEGLRAHDIVQEIIEATEVP
jgi:MoxR-like ATPase